MNRFTKMVVASLGLAFVAGPGMAADFSIPDGVKLEADSKNQAEVSKNGVYIVRLAENPVAAYDGEIKGYRATRPRGNSKLNPMSKAAISYAGYLTRRHDEVLAKVGGGKKLYSYKYSYNGFAAKLDRGQVSALKKMPGVLSVSADDLMQMDTVTTPMMLDLTGGIWSELGGVDNAGEGVIVGVIDSGIWPESESFQDRTGSNKKGKDGKLNFHQVPGWRGKCTPGEAFAVPDCNQKLVGAQWFNAGFGGDAGVKAAFSYEFASARDADGHGTHTSSTAAGNAGVDVDINGSFVGVASGMAPRARVAMYKVCWGTGGEGGCFGSDSVAAIDQAVFDGVDVLNFSISGSQSSSLDQVEVAFLFAAGAGVFVAASAGNSGPDASTVAHNTPWLITVAAGTHDRGYKATISVVNGADYDGVSLGSGVGPQGLVYSADVTAEDAVPVEGRLCVPGTLDAGMVAGKIVLCDRGAIARVDKSLAVHMAGGVGMILANVVGGAESLNADFHSVPTVHVAPTEGDALRNLAILAVSQAKLSPGTQFEAEASQVAGFSSRGPALAGHGDLLKPDIMAPGVDIIAAVSPEGNGGENFGALSGTSMSSPHMAGLGALMKHAKPGWSPAAIKSAFMTTATQKTNMGNAIDGTPFGYGAGFVQPNDATDPGLVYDAGWNDWLGYLCGTGELRAGFCSDIGIDPSDLNYPSIAIGSLAGLQTISRTVTNVGGAGTYTYSIDGLDGIHVSIDPAVLTLAAGESVNYEITFTNTGALFNTYVFGGITWSDGTHSVRSAVALNPVELAAPAELSFATTEGSETFEVVFGYAGDYSVEVSGLVAAEMQSGNVVDDPTNDILTALFVTGVGVTFHEVEVSADTELLRVSLFDEFTDGNDDLDLYVFGPRGEFGQSGSGTSAEQVDIVNPSMGTYDVVVHGWQTDGPDSNYTLFSWSPSSDADNMSVSDVPSPVAKAETAEITVNWSGLLVDKYLGVLSHKTGPDEIGQTVISIQTDLSE